VAVKSQEQQAAGLVFRTRDLLVRQRTQLINAIRGHLTEYGWGRAQGAVACGAELATDNCFMMGWTPRPTASMCQSGGVEHHLREASVSKVSIIGLDIAKHAFHAHGADGRGRVMFSKRISRGKLLDFFATQPSCTVALEACGGAHHQSRHSFAASRTALHRRAGSAELHGQAGRADGPSDGFYVTTPNGQHLHIDRAAKLTMGCTVDDW